MIYLTWMIFRKASGSEKSGGEPRLRRQEYGQTQRNGTRESGLRRMTQERTSSESIYFHTILSIIMGNNLETCLVSSSCLFNFIGKFPSPFWIKFRKQFATFHRIFPGLLEDNLTGQFNQFITCGTIDFGKEFRGALFIKNLQFFCLFPCLFPLALRIECFTVSIIGVCLKLPSFLLSLLDAFQHRVSARFIHFRQPSGNRTAGSPITFL